MSTPPFLSLAARPLRRARRLTMLLGAVSAPAAALAVPPAHAARIARAVARPVGQDTTGVVTGVVRGPGGTVIVGAEVMVTPVATVVRAGDAPPARLAAARRTYTDEAGRFRIPGLAPGRVTLAVRRIGYRPRTRELDVPLAGPVEFALDAVPQQLGAVVVAAQGRTRYTGWAARFYERRDRGMGRYLTRQDIDRRGAMVTTDLLRNIPGVRIVSTPRGNRLRMRNSNCDPFVWLDGAPASAGYLDVDAFQPMTLEGIEVYNGVSSVPVELRGPRGEEACGVIALWSRMPEPRGKRAKKQYTAEDLATLVAQATVFTAEQVDQAAQVDTSHTIAPVYPDSLKRAKVPGEALVEFVVDTTGVPELETIGVVAATHALFGTAARDAVPSARFVPARREGRAVRQLVQLPVRFEATTP